MSYVSRLRTLRLIKAQYMNQIFEGFHDYIKFSLWLKFNVLVNSPKRTCVLVGHLAKEVEVGSL